jgi:hypothetical protein
MKNINRPILGWAVFVILGGVSGYLRYGKVLSGQHLSLMQTAAPYVVLGLHVAVVLQAFKDSVYQGILCVLIPPYSVYYLFMISDDFALRGVVAGLLVGLGQDAGLTYAELFRKSTAAIQGFISSGGGEAGQLETQ